MSKSTAVATPVASINNPQGFTRLERVTSMLFVLESGAIMYGETPNTQQPDNVKEFENQAAFNAGTPIERQTTVNVAASPVDVTVTPPPAITEEPQPEAPKRRRGRPRKSETPQATTPPVVTPAPQPETATVTTPENPIRRRRRSNSTGTEPQASTPPNKETPSTPPSKQRPDRPDFLVYGKIENALGTAVWKPKDKEIKMAVLAYATEKCKYGDPKAGIAKGADALRLYLAFISKNGESYYVMKDERFNNNDKRGIGRWFDDPAILSVDWKKD